MAGYKKIGYVLGFVGGVLMILLPLLDLIGRGISTPLGLDRYVGVGIGGNELLRVAILIIIAVIILGIIGTGPLRISDEPSPLLVGILLIILGYIGGTLGGLLALLGGIFYIIEAATDWSRIYLGLLAKLKQQHSQNAECHKSIKVVVSAFSPTPSKYWLNEIFSSQKEHFTQI